MNKTKNIPIVLISSDEYIQYCATTMVSILLNIKRNIHINFYILSLNLTPVNKKILKEITKHFNCDIFFPELKESILEIFKNVKVPAHVSKSTFLRLLMPDILKEEPKAIFIDSDTICRHDISELFNISLEDNYYGMVEDVANEINSKYLWDQISNDYYNGGVLLANLKKLRNENYINKMNEQISKNISRYLICDQDILNDTFRGKILRISNKWNFFHEYHFLRPKYTPTDELDYINSLKNPAIIHFVGKIKPWQKECNHLYKNEWFKYYKQTPFYKIERLNFYKKSILKIIKNIFSIENKDKHKIFTIAGIKIKFINRKKEKINIPISANNIDYDTFFNLQIALEKVKKLHMQTLPPFKNIYKDKDIVICGSGPTLNKYIQIPNAIHMGLNCTFRNPNLKLDYLFAWDYANLKRNDPTFFDDLKKYDCKKFFGCFLHDNIGQVPQCIVEDLNAYQLYSSARFGFCQDPIDPTIHYDIEVSPLMDFMSVAFFAFHFALYTRPKRIFLVGIDNSLNGYFDEKTKQKFLLTNKILEGWKKVKKFMSLYYPDIEVISVNPVGLKGLFKDIYTDDDSFKKILEVNTKC